MPPGSSSTASVCRSTRGSSADSTASAEITVGSPHAARIEVDGIAADVHERPAAQIAVEADVAGLHDEMRNAVVELDALDLAKDPRGEHLQQPTREAVQSVVEPHEGASAGGIRGLRRSPPRSCRSPTAASRTARAFRPAARAPPSTTARSRAAGGRRGRRPDGSEPSRSRPTRAHRGDQPARGPAPDHGRRSRSRARRPTRARGPRSPARRCRRHRGSRCRSRDRSSSGLHPVPSTIGRSTFCTYQPPTAAT